jgi:beta-lactamase superfamily II metal-dependent hydrolase
MSVKIPLRPMKRVLQKKFYLNYFWGIELKSLVIEKQNGRLKVDARWGRGVYVNADDIGDESLLEFYFIDVGQGDGVLIVTPDRKHILIDGE